MYKHLFYVNLSIDLMKPPYCLCADVVVVCVFPSQLNIIPLFPSGNVSKRRSGGIADIWRDVSSTKVGGQYRFVAIPWTGRSAIEERLLPLLACCLPTHGVASAGDNGALICLGTYEMTRVVGLLLQATFTLTDDDINSMKEVELK